MKKSERRDIGADDRSISDLFNNKRYTIDSYQREYKWETKQVAELIADLTGKFLDYYEEGHERTEVASYGHYFLGSIIFSHREGDIFIIDGQQRLTSIILLMIYLNHRQQRIPKENQVGIENLLVTKKFGKITFCMDVDEREKCLGHLYKGEKFLPTIKDPEAVRNMVARYTDIEERFPQEIDDNSLPYFIDWLLNNVHLVEITAYSDDDAYEIFETMNDRGLSLAPLDMLKSFIIARIDGEEEKERINEIWKKRSNELLERNKEEPSDAVKAWLRSQFANTIRGGKKGSKPGDFDRLGTEFHRWVRENEEQLGLVNSKSFVRFVERDYEFYTRKYLDLLTASFTPLTGLETIYYTALFEFTLQHPILLAPLTVEDSDQICQKKMNIVATYLDILLARRIWNYKSITYSTLQYSMFTVIKDIRNKPISELGNILTERLKADELDFSTNPSFRMHQMNRYQIKWLLARITDYCEVYGDLPSHIQEFMAEGRKRAFEVEHIWANHWEQHKADFDHEADFDEYRNRIGALLLLPRTFNESYGDLSYEKKLPHYLKNNLLAQSLNENGYERNPVLKKLVKSGLPYRPHPKFRKEDIEIRQKLYIEIAKKVWDPNRIMVAAQ